MFSYLVVTACAGRVCRLALTCYSGRAGDDGGGEGGVILKGTQGMSLGVPFSSI